MERRQVETRPRGLAIRILTEVLSNGRALDESMEALASGTSREDRAWLSEVCSGTLRLKGRLDLIIDEHALQKKPTGWLRKALLIGVYQLVAQDRVPPAWVVSETVTLIKSKEGDSPSKFANAVLRKVADHRDSWKKIPYPGKGSLTEKSRWASLPEWMWMKLSKTHGEEQTQKFAVAALDRPEIWIRGVGSVAPLEERFAAGPVDGSFRRLENASGPITEESGFSEGRFFVQDVSSQVLIAEAHAEISHRGQKTGRALDLCAAPGGKALGLATLGWHVDATDIDAKRITLLEQNIERVAKPQRLHIEIQKRDGLKSLSPWDLVWVDAPCTGSGILRRHPEVRWLRQEKELHALKQTQTALVQEAWSLVKPGGFLMYSVCSVFREEGIETLERAKLGQSILKKWDLSPEQAPYGDGFFGALLQK